jgi:hypothetical protein
MRSRKTNGIGNTIDGLFAIDDVTIVDHRNDPPLVARRTTEADNNWPEVRSGW